MKAGSLRWMLGVIAVLTTAVGCGGKSDVPPASVGGPGDGQTVSAAGAQQPDAVLAQFLDALRKGDDRTVSTLLTQKAYAETQKAGLKVQPPGAPSMTFQIGQTEYVSETKDDAHVGSVWTEKLESGEVQRLEAIWVMKLEAQGWRVAGMATQIGEENKLVFLDFEDPEDLMKKWEEGAQPADPAADQQLPPPQGEVRPPQVSDREAFDNTLRK